MTKRTDGLTATRDSRVRKRDTGEQGNQGEFAGVNRTEAAIAVPESSPAVQSESGDSSTGPRLRVPTWSAARIEHKVELANRRLEREGIVERFVLERNDEEIAYRRPTGDEVEQYGYVPWQQYEFQYSTLTLNRPSISHEGWQFDAALDRVPGTDEFMMRSVPGRDFGGWRPEPGRCDHCGKYRDRNTTYLVTSEKTGETLQVGASCMEVFLGVRPKGIWSLTASLEPDDDGEGPPVSTREVEDNRELIAKALVASDMGKRYVSKSRALEWGSASTADRIEPLFGSTTYRRVTEEDRLEREQARQQLTEVLESGMVDEVITAAREVRMDSDYGRNLNTALDAGFSTEKMAGTVISAVSAYGRKNREAVQAKVSEDRIAAATPGFAAPVKTRMRDVPVTVTNVFEGTRPAYAWPHRDEPFQIITMRDAAGHEIVWKTSAIQPVAAGDEVTMTGTVKEHSEFRGVDQTVVSRAKIDTVDSSSVKTGVSAPS
ncbi:hypothetical protein [Brachybacterium atlanticum]|uniref:hypothetical protein n=1 Tax=Brachybacterium atlanticum TaxID=2911888 RepID=UPI0021E01B26|nr:hypothetical protein [Brachybacterium atlanticum]